MSRAILLLSWVNFFLVAIKVGQRELIHQHHQKLSYSNLITVAGFSEVSVRSSLSYYTKAEWQNY
jgi:hypothetical protein